MICDQCLEEKSNKDFYGSRTCYKCIYKNKTSFIQKSNCQIKQCKLCKNTIPEGNFAYCSDECAKKGKELHNKNYWIHNCNAPKVKWNH